MLKGLVMKGLGERDVRAGTFAVGAVNDADWARQYVLEQSGQNGVDTKAFKGRGKFHELRVMLTEIDRLEKSMQELVEVTKCVPGYLMHLTMHVHNNNGAASLRWRDRSGARKHLSWEEATELVCGMPSEVVGWYARVTSQCQVLNERHKELRRGVAVVRRLISSTPSKVYARAVLPQ